MGQHTLPCSSVRVAYHSDVFSTIVPSGAQPSGRNQLLHEFRVGTRDGELRIFGTDGIRRTEEKPGMGFFQHRHVIVRITGGQHVKIQTLDRRNRMALLVALPKRIAANVSFIINL